MGEETDRGCGGNNPRRRYPKAVATVVAHFRERGSTVSRVRDTPDDPEGLARRILEACLEHVADTSARASGSPVVVEVVPQEPPRRRTSPRRRRATPQGELLRTNAEAVRDAEKMWRQHREVVDRWGESGREHPVETVRRHVEAAHKHIVEAHRSLSKEFGIWAEDRGTLERSRLVVDGARFDLADGGEVAAVCDAMWRFATYDGVRVAINRAFVGAKQRSEVEDGDERIARAACEAVVHVLRSRPMLYGVFALCPDFLRGREGAGLAEVREAALILLAGWVAANLKRTDWVLPSGKVAPNRLREALVELAGKKGTVDGALLQELPGATFDELCRLLEEAKADPEKARTKRDHNSLRNRVATRLSASISAEGRMRREGRHVAEDEADAERALMAYQQTAAEDVERELLDALEAAAALSPQQREIVRLRLGGKKNPEIAAELKTTTNNVEKQMSVAVRKMRDAGEEAAGY